MYALLADGVFDPETGGAELATVLRRVAAEEQVLWCSAVTDDNAVEAITSGALGIIAGLKPGKVYVEISTISPRTSRQVAEHVRSVGAQMLDAPVSGSVPQADSGTLAIMVGGSDEAFNKVEPFLREFGQSVTHVGENGQGWCSSSRSTSALRFRPSRSARDCCSPSVRGSNRDLPLT